MIKIEIPIKLPSLNEYINLCRSNKFEAAKYKKRIEWEIGLFIGALPEFKNPVIIHFLWIEGNKKRDLDNIAFAKKFILDALVKRGKLKDDNRRYVTAFTDNFEYGKETKVVLFFEESEK